MNEDPIVKMPRRGYGLRMRSQYMTNDEWLQIGELLKSRTGMSYREIVDCIEEIKQILRMTAATGKEPLDENDGSDNIFY